MRGIIRVEWHRDPKGYDVIEQWGPSGACVDSIDRDYWRKYYDKPELWFVSRTCALEQREKNAYVLEGTDNRVFLELANAPQTIEGALAFLNKWGELKGFSQRPFREFFEIAERMKKVVVTAKDNPKAAIGLMSQKDWAR